jgi:hypothetical protein
MRSIFGRSNKNTVGPHVSQNGNNETCNKRELDMNGSICEKVFDASITSFGPIEDISSPEEEMFYLDFKGRDMFRFFTRVRSSRDSKKFIRYLSLEKVKEGMELVKDETPRTNVSENFRKIEYFVEIWHEDVDRTFMPFPNRKKAPLLRRKLQDLYVDPMELPRDLGAEFFIRIIAIGKPLRTRKIKLNAKFVIEYRGKYELAIERDKSLDTKVNLGEFKVLPKGKPS